MHKIIDTHQSTDSGRGRHRSPGTTKKLTLHRETLRELTNPTLQRIVGGGTSGRLVCDEPSMEACSEGC